MPLLMHGERLPCTEGSIYGLVYCHSTNVQRSAKKTHSRVQGTVTTLEEVIQ